MSSPRVELTGHSQETSGEVGRKVSGGLWMKKTKKKMALIFKAKLQRKKKMFLI